MENRLNLSEDLARPAPAPVFTSADAEPVGGDAEKQTSSPGLLARRHRRHANPFAVRHPVPAFDPVAHFGRSAPIALDIGCGPGRFVAQLAQARPEYNVLGLEIRAHLVASTCAAVALAQRAARERGAAPVYGHALLANANVHLPTLLAERTVGFVSVNFPDPWYKKRHHKRRVLSEALLQVLRNKLLPGAQIHVMTDYEPLAHAMREALAAQDWLRDMVGAGVWCAHSTTGLTSEREQTHMARGEPIYRMAYQQVA